MAGVLIRAGDVPRMGPGLGGRVEWNFGAVSILARRVMQTYIFNLNPVVPIWYPDSTL